MKLWFSKKEPEKLNLMKYVVSYFTPIPEHVSLRHYVVRTKTQSGVVRVGIRPNGKSFYGMVAVGSNTEQSITQMREVCKQYNFKYS